MNANQLNWSICFGVLQRLNEKKIVGKSEYEMLVFGGLIPELKEVVSNAMDLAIEYNYCNNDLLAKKELRAELNLIKECIKLGEATIDAL